MVGHQSFDIPKMRAIFKSVWVRKLIGKLGVPYNRRLAVRACSHPLNYDADLSLPAADSNAFRIHWLLPCPERLTASWTVLDSSGANRAPIRIPLYSAFLTFGLPSFVFIFCLTFMLTQSYFMFNI
jgi:hypothetical protein